MVSVLYMQSTTMLNLTTARVRKHKIQQNWNEDPDTVGMLNESLLNSLHFIVDF